MAQTVYVSYHHAKDQAFADSLRSFYGCGNTLIGQPSPQELDNDDDDYILSEIRTKHLRNSTVTVVLIGEETWASKWVDWEIYASLAPYESHAVNGLLGILLPGVQFQSAPPRFLDNYHEKQVHGFLPSNIRQTGFARLVKWQDINPPTSWGTFMAPFFREDSDKAMATLHHWIDSAYANRANTSLINNSRVRYKHNKPLKRRNPKHY